MKPESGKTESAWTDTADMPAFPTLDSNLTADVCVIGAGIAGLTTAYLLVNAGKSVIVIDDGPICGGETQRTTAHLSNVIDDRYFKLAEQRGEAKAKLAYESHTAAIDLIEANIKEEKISCDFTRLDGYLFRGDKDKDSTLDKELKAAQKAGFADCEIVDTVPLPFFPEPRKAIRFPRQGQFHVLKYLRILARAIVRDGGQIFTNAHAEDVLDGKPAKVQIKNGRTITAGAVVVATNSPVTDWAKIHTKQAPYRTYVIAGKIPVDSMPIGLYWDTEDPYHYIRTTRLEDDSSHVLLIVGGEDHRTGQEKHPEECFDALEEWSKKMFPILKKIDFKWSGQVLETMDGMAFIGKDPAHGDNVYVATGDSGMGMTHGTIAGMLLTDLILGKPNAWAALYDPSRKPLLAAADYLMENANTAWQYTDYLKPAEVKAVKDIPCGEGAVMHHEGETIAVYRESDCKKTAQCSAICPHMKAVLQWNSVEKSWDCPAHGSRFKGTGEVINGPANSDLKAIPEGKRVHDDMETEQLPPMPPGDSGIQPPPPS